MPTYHIHTYTNHSFDVEARDDREAHLYANFETHNRGIEDTNAVIWAVDEQGEKLLIGTIYLQAYYALPTTWEAYQKTVSELDEQAQANAYEVTGFKHHVRQTYHVFATTDSEPSGITSLMENRPGPTTETEWKSLIADYKQQYPDLREIHVEVVYDSAASEAKAKQYAERSAKGEYIENEDYVCCSGAADTLIWHKAANVTRPGNKAAAHKRAKTTTLNTGIPTYSCKLKFSLWYAPKDEDGFTFWDDVIPEFATADNRDANLDERMDVSMWETMEKAFDGHPETGITVTTEDNKFGNSPKGHVTITKNRIEARFEDHDGSQPVTQTFENGSFSDLMEQVSDLGHEAHRRILNIKTTT